MPGTVGAWSLTLSCRCYAREVFTAVVPSLLRSAAARAGWVLDDTPITDHSTERDAVCLHCHRRRFVA